MSDLVRPGPRVVRDFSMISILYVLRVHTYKKGSRDFIGLDGLQYRWRPGDTNTGILLVCIITLFRLIFSKRARFPS